MSITVLDGGLLTTIQDLGRHGYQQFGVSVSGAMDPRACTIANILVGNKRNEGVFECTMMGPKLQFDVATNIAITGGSLFPLINNVPVADYRCIAVSRGDILTFGGLQTGARSYVSVAGGLDLPLVMDSMSTDMRAKIGGYEGRKLESGDMILLRKPSQGVMTMPSYWTISSEIVPMPCYTLRVILGPQDDYFTQNGIMTFLSKPYTLTPQFDRMGCRLEGDVIEHVNDGNIISDGIAFGAIQVPSEGKPIIMLADRQTTGGYAKIGTVVTADFQILGQLKVGDKVRFVQVSVEEAQEAYLAQEKSYGMLEKALKLAQMEDQSWYSI